MGVRGPKAGWKRAAAGGDAPAVAAKALSNQAGRPDEKGAAESPTPPPTVKAAAKTAPARKANDAPPAQPTRMSAADSINPMKLSGQALKDLAHRMGIARSDAAGMSDDRLREQLRYRTSHLYETEGA